MENFISFSIREEKKTKRGISLFIIFVRYWQLLIHVDFPILIFEMLHRQLLLLLLFSYYAFHILVYKNWKDFYLYFNKKKSNKPIINNTCYNILCWHWISTINLLKYTKTFRDFIWILSVSIRFIWCSTMNNKRNLVYLKIKWNFDCFLLNTNFKMIN